MKIAIVGTGAMGSVYAGLLGDRDNEVWAIDTWQAHIDAIRTAGLRVEGASGDRIVELNATSKPSDVGVVDLAIIATKAMQVEGAAADAKVLIGPETTVLTIQNGLGSAEKVAHVLGPDNVIIGVAGGFGASIQEPGHVHHNGWEFIRLGEMDGPVTPRLERVADVWRDAGFKVKTYDDIDGLIWEKLICNVCYSGTCAVLERTIGEVVHDEQAWKVASTCALEAYQVAQARGIVLHIDNAVQYVRDFGLKIPHARPSMLLDLMAGRKSEIDAINGAIPPAAQAVNLNAPYNEVVTAMVKAKETRF